MNAKKMVPVYIFTGAFLISSLMSLYFLTSFYVGNNKMYNCYKNDENYEMFSGVVVKQDSNILRFSIVSHDGNEKPVLGYFNSSSFSVYCLNFEHLNNLVQSFNEKEIQFITNRKYYHEGMSYPIVQITYQGDELLSFSEGKEALMKSIKRKLFS